MPSATCSVAGPPDFPGSPALPRGSPAPARGSAALPSGSPAPARGSAALPSGSPGSVRRSPALARSAGLGGSPAAAPDTPAATAVAPNVSGGTSVVWSRGGLAGARAGPPPDSRPQARRSAAANCGQVAYRSAGTLARALARTSSTATGRSGRRLVSVGGSADTWAHMTAMDSSRTNGGWPVSMV